MTDLPVLLKQLKHEPIIPAGAPPTAALYEQAVREIIADYPSLLTDLEAELAAWGERLSTFYEQRCKNKENLQWASDALVVAEALVYCQNISHDLHLLRSILACESPAQERGVMTPLSLTELEYLYQRLLLREKDAESKRKSTTAAVLPSLPAAPEAAPAAAGPRPRPDLLLKRGSNENTQPGKSAAALYKAPKTTAVAFTGDKSSKAEYAADRAQEDQERLQRTEFARAITEQFMDVPTIRDDGRGEMKWADVRQIKQIESREALREEAFGSIGKVTKKERRRYDEMRQRQGAAAVGTMPGELGSLADNIVDEDLRPSKKRRTKDTRH